MDFPLTQRLIDEFNPTALTSAEDDASDGDDLMNFGRKHFVKCLRCVYAAMVHGLHEGGVCLADGPTGPAAPHLPAENTHQGCEGNNGNTNGNTNNQSRLSEAPIGFPPPRILSSFPREPRRTRFQAAKMHLTPNKRA